MDAACPVLIPHPSFSVFFSFLLRLSLRHRRPPPSLLTSLVFILCIMSESIESLRRNPSWRKPVPRFIPSPPLSPPAQDCGPPKLPDDWKEQLNRALKAPLVPPRTGETETISYTSMRKQALSIYTNGASTSTQGSSPSTTLCSDSYGEVRGPISVSTASQRPSRKPSRRSSLKGLEPRPPTPPKGFRRDDALGRRPSSSFRKAHPDPKDPLPSDRVPSRPLPTLFNPSSSSAVSRPIGLSLISEQIDSYSTTATWYPMGEVRREDSRDRRKAGDKGVGQSSMFTLSGPALARLRPKKRRSCFAVVRDWVVRAGRGIASWF